MGEAGHRVHHQALGIVGILHQQRQHPPLEVGGVEVGERRVEAIDQDAGNGLGLLVVPQGAHHPFIVHAEQLIGGAHHVAQELEQAQQDREGDPRNDPHGQHADEGDEGQPEGGAVRVAQGPEAAKIGERQGGHHQHHPEGGGGNELQRRRQVEGDEGDHSRGYDGDQLALAAVGVVDRGA